MRILSRLSHTISFEKRGKYMCNMRMLNNLMTRGDFLKRSALVSAATVGGATLAGCSTETENGAAAQGGTTEAERTGPDQTTRVDANTKVVLLGVGGGPVAKENQHGISQAIVVGESVYLVDCGTGVYDQLYKAGLVGRLRQTERLRNVFLTHMHSDHTADYFSSLLLGWPEHEINVYGPGRPKQMPREFAPAPEGGFPIVDPLGITPVPGLEDMTRFSTAAFAYDINLRMRDEGFGNLTDYIVPHDIAIPEGVGRDYDYEETDEGVVGTAPSMEPFVVLPEDDNGVTVSATLVNHAPVFPAFAYRFDTPDGSIVVSGDTSPSDNLINLAQGADILVHEVLHQPSVEEIVPEDAPNRDATLQHIYSAHTASTAVGKVAQQAGVGKLVLTHLIPADGVIPDEIWHEHAKADFDGEVIVGKDLAEAGI